MISTGKNDWEIAMIVDAWMQHPSGSTLNQEMFASLRRWSRSSSRPVTITHEMTIAAMDEGSVSVGLASAWCAPNGWMTTNDQVAALAQAYPGRIANASRVFKLAI